MVLANFWPGCISTFWAKKIRQEKQTKFKKIFELYQVFMYDFLCQTVLIFPIYILFTKKWTHFRLEVSVVYGVLAHFEPEYFQYIYYSQKESTHFGPKTHTRKIDKIDKVF